MAVLKSVAVLAHGYPILSGHALPRVSNLGCVRESGRYLGHSRRCLGRSRRYLGCSRGAIAKDDLGGAPGGRQHTAGGPVCQEVAHVLPLCKRRTHPHQASAPAYPAERQLSGHCADAAAAVHPEARQETSACARSQVETPAVLSLLLC